MVNDSEASGKSSCELSGSNEKREKCRESSKSPSRRKHKKSKHSKKKLKKKSSKRKRHHKGRSRSRSKSKERLRDASPSEYGHTDLKCALKKESVELTNWEVAGDTSVCQRAATDEVNTVGKASHRIANKASGALVLKEEPGEVAKEKNSRGFCGKSEKVEEKNGSVDLYDVYDSGLYFPKDMEQEKEVKNVANQTIDAKDIEKRSKSRSASIELSSSKEKSESRKMNASKEKSSKEQKSKDRKSTDKKSKSKDRSKSRQKRSSSKHRRSRSKGRRSKSKDRKSRSRDRKSRSKDRKSRSRDRKSRSKDRKSRSKDRKSRSRDRKSRSKDRKPRSRDRKSRSKDRKSRSKDRKSRSKEKKRSRKEKSRSKEERSRSKDRRSKKRRSESKEKSRKRSRERSTSRRRLKSRERRRSRSSERRSAISRHQSLRSRRSRSNERHYKSRSRSNDERHRSRLSSTNRYRRSRSKQRRSRSDDRCHHSRSWNRSRRSSSRRRYRSRSRSPRRSRRSKSQDDVAASVPVNLTRALGVPTSSLTTTTAGDVKPTKSIADFTALCKQITESKEEENTPEENKTEEDKVSHPFSVKPAKEIVIPPVIFPVSRPTEPDRPLEQAFPVSRGNQHKTKENTNESTVGAIDGSVATAEQVFESNVQAEKLDVSGLIAKRMEAQNRLQSNPQDFEAKLMLEEVQMKMQNWASVNLKPGQFTGESLVSSVVPKGNINSGYQAWARKDMFHNLAPIKGGVGMKLLQKMGWQPGQVLGKRGEGSYEPIALNVKMDRKGLVSFTEAGSKGKGGKGGGRNMMAAQAVQVPEPALWKEYRIKCGRKILVQLLIKLENTKLFEQVYSIAFGSTSAGCGKHPVSALAELCTKKRWSTPVYKIAHESGPAHKKDFLFQVVVNGISYQHNIASNNKKHAKAESAFAALKALGVLPQDAVMSL